MTEKQSFTVHICEGYKQARTLFLASEPVLYDFDNNEIHTFDYADDLL